MADVAQVSYLISYHLRSLSSSNALLLDDDVFLLMLKNIDRYWLFWGAVFVDYSSFWSRKNSFCCSISRRSSSFVGIKVRYLAAKSWSLLLRTE